MTDELKNSIEYFNKIRYEYLKFFKLCISFFPDKDEEALEITINLLKQLPKYGTFNILFFMTINDPESLLIQYQDEKEEELERVFYYSLIVMQSSEFVKNNEDIDMDKVSEMFFEQIEQIDKKFPNNKDDSADTEQTKISTIATYAFWFLLYQHTNNLEHIGLVDLTTRFLEQPTQNDNYYEAFLKISIDMGYNATLPKDFTEKDKDIQLPEINFDFCNFPSSSALSLLSDIAGSGKDFDKLPGRKAKYSHNPKGLKRAKIKDKGDPAISYNIGENKTIISITDMDKLAHNAHQRKLTRHLLRLANEQCCNNGVMSRYDVEFPLSDLVGNNLYKNLDTARKGFYTAMGTLQSLQITGKTERKGKNGKTLEQGERVNIFVKSSVKNGVCKVWLNPFMNWEYLFQFFTILPDYYLQLPDSSSDLLEYIFVQARQHGADIKAGKGFNISFRSICYKLNIPIEEEVSSSTSKKRDYNRFIKKPLEEAISGLTTMKDSGYTITVHCDNELPISQYLDTGYIEIAVKSDSPYFKPLTDMSRRKEQLIQQREEKAERIAAKVQATIEERKQKKAKAKQDT